RRRGRRRLRHDRGQESRVKAEALIERNVLRALRERVEPGVPRSPAREALHHRLEEPARDAAIPEIGSNGERAEEPDAAPARREDGAGEPPVDVGGERGARVGAPARRDPVAVAGERRWIGKAEERAERDPEDAIRLTELIFAERTN